MSLSSVLQYLKPQRRSYPSHRYGVPRRRAVGRLRIEQLEHRLPLSASGYEQTSLAADQPGAALVPDAVSWYQAEGSAADSVGGNDGAIHGDVTFRPGRVGQAFDFDGVEDYVDLGSDSSLDLPGSMSVSLWVRLETLDHSKYFLADFLPASGNTSQGSLGTVVDGSTFAWVQSYTDGGTTYDTLAGTTPIQLNRWFHLAVVRDDPAKSVRLYVNGVEESSLSYADETVVPLQGSKILGGSGLGFPTDFIDGRLDQVGIFSRALSSAEIQTLHSNRASSATEIFLPAFRGMNIAMQRFIPSEPMIPPNPVRVSPVFALNFGTVSGALPALRGLQTAAARLIPSEPVRLSPIFFGLLGGTVDDSVA